MKIGLDARELIPGRAGKGWYVYHVLSNLIEIDRNNTYVLYSDKEIDFPNSQNIRKIILPQKGLLWHFAMPGQLKRDKIDLYWAPTSPIVPALTNIATVIVIHDLTNLLFPKTHTPKGRIIDKIFLRRAIHKTKSIITISGATRADISRFFPNSTTKICLTYLGYDRLFRKYSEIEVAKTLAKFNLKPGYILSVGTLEPRKNIITVLESYARLDKKVLEDRPLVIVGNKGWKYGPIFDKVIRLGLENKIKFLGYLKIEELAQIFSGAAVFLMPSLYEGFGLPALEAMACGVPVITSNISSLPEVAGEAGILVDPMDSTTIAAETKKIINNPKHALALSNKSLAQAKKFSWQKTAKETLDVFENTLTNQKDQD